MQKKEIRDLLRAQPFRPFKVHLPEGRQVEIFHHDFALLSQDGRTLVAYGPDRSLNIIDVMLISSCELGPQPDSTEPPKPASSNGTSVA